MILIIEPTLNVFKYIFLQTHLQKNYIIYFFMEGGCFLSSHSTPLIPLLNENNLLISIH